MISILKAFLRPLKNFHHVSRGLECYFRSLAAEASKYTYLHVSMLPHLNAFQFSRLLMRSPQTSSMVLSHLSKKSIKILSKTESVLSHLLRKLPWKVYLIIDSTPQKRSSSKAENINRFILGG